MARTHSGILPIPGTLVQACRQFERDKVAENRFFCQKAVTDPSPRQSIRWGLCQARSITHVKSNCGGTPLLHPRGQQSCWLPDDRI